MQIDFFSAGKDVILLDIEWPTSYPNVLPTISMDSFFNRSIRPEVKAEIIQVSFKLSADKRQNG